MTFASITRRAPRFVLGLILSCTLAFAQEFRATILGVVTDPTGAVVPAAKITMVNSDTQVASSTESNNEGNFVVPYLQPGTYILRVEHAGFKIFDRRNLELRVGDRVRLDAKLELGDAADHVTVFEQSSLLELASGSGGQVIGNRSITDLPVRSKNPYTLVILSAGVQYNGNPIYFRPFDNGAMSDFSINGGQ